MSFFLFFFFLFLSRRRRSPSPEFNQRAVWPTEQTAQSVSKTISGRHGRRSETNGPAAKGDPAPEEEWIEIALKIEIEKQPTILEVTQSGFFFFLSIKKEGEIFPNPSSGTIVVFEVKVVLLASDGDEGGGGGGSGGLGVEAGAPPVGQELSVKGGVEETGEGVAVHQGVNLELGLLVHQVAGLGQGLVDSFSDPRVQTHLGQERNTDRAEQRPPVGVHTCTWQSSRGGQPEARGPRLAP